MSEQYPNFVFCLSLKKCLPKWLFTSFVLDLKFENIKIFWSVFVKIHSKNIIWPLPLNVIQKYFKRSKVSLFIDGQILYRNLMLWAKLRLEINIQSLVSWGKSADISISYDFKRVEQKQQIMKVLPHFSPQQDDVEADVPWKNVFLLRLQERI